MNNGGRNSETLEVSDTEEKAPQTLTEALDQLQLAYKKEYQSRNSAPSAGMAAALVHVQAFTNKLRVPAEMLMFDDCELAGPSSLDLLAVCIDLARMLMRKNVAYGDSALNPVRIMSKADAEEQILVRMDDKLSRLIRGQAAGEDAVMDLVGYWVLLKVCQKRKALRIEADA